MADEQDATAFPRQPAQHGKQVVGLLWSEYRGRFVENQQFDVLHQAANDFHPLTLTDGEAMNQAIRLQWHAITLGHFTDLRFQLFGRSGGCTEGQRHVLGDAQGFEQREVLEHHPDAALTRLRGVAHDDRLAFPADLPGVGLRDAVDDLHQRAFASTVLAEQCVYFAGIDDEIDAVIGQTAWILLGDAVQLQAGLGCIGHGNVRWKS